MKHLCFRIFSERILSTVIRIEQKNTYTLNFSFAFLLDLGFHFSLAVCKEFIRLVILF